MTIEQKPGSIPLSPDILAKTDIGIWAFELDEGKPPRMYVDDVMLGLIGLEHQISPEETYHAWYDRIDSESYGLVSDTVTKMTAGEHAEVQYSWHHPDGRTLLVRCGGVRNPAYSPGIRIEGIHQNISDILHYDIRDSQSVEAVINAFAKENRATYIVNVNDSTFRIYGDVQNINDELAANRQFEGAMHQFAENYIHPSDRGPFLAKFGNVNCLTYLPVGGSTSLEYRSNAVSKEYTWSRVTGQRINADTILAGFKGCDQEILLRIVSEKLIDDYDAIYMVELDRDEIRSAHPRMVDINSAITGITKYSDVIKDIAETVAPAYKDDWLKFSNPARMKEYMAKSDHREYVYELPGEKRVMRRFTVDVLERVSGEASVLLLSFAGIDDLRAQTLILQQEATELNEKLARRMAISDYFLHSFDTAFYVNLLTNDTQVLHGGESSQMSDKGKITTEKETPEFYTNNFIHQQDREMFLKMMNHDNIRRMLKTSAEFSFLFHDANAGLGQAFRCTVIRGEDADHVAVAFKNVTEELEAAERMQQVTRLANQDALTGVGSPARYMEAKAALNREIEAGTAEPFAIVECDANNLKEVNDCFGHDKGDMYLKLVCRTICGIFCNSKVFRTGGDEFVVLLKDREYEDREKLIALARAASNPAVSHGAKPNEHTGKSPSFACGMGVFEPGRDRTTEDVFRRADADMYANKKQMKNEALKKAGMPETKGQTI